MLVWVASECRAWDENVGAGCLSDRSYLKRREWESWEGEAGKEDEQVTAVAMMVQFCSSLQMHIEHLLQSCALQKEARAVTTSTRFLPLPQGCPWWWSFSGLLIPACTQAEWDAHGRRPWNRMQTLRTSSFLEWRGQIRVSLLSYRTVQANQLLPGHLLQSPPHSWLLKFPFSHPWKLSLTIPLKFHSAFKVLTR